MRIVSLLPSATEIVGALGLIDSLVGVTHECDYPPGVEALPHVTANLLPAGLPSAEIDRLVSESLRADAHTIYALDADRLRELAPDVILTQALCEVCAVPTSVVEAVACTMPAHARVVSLDPLSLDGVLASVVQAAEALGVAARGRRVAATLRAELARIAEAVASAPRPRVLALEWLDPPYCGGHWVPEMVAAAGGSDPFGAPGEPSHPLVWEDIVEADPDVIILMPCGFHVSDVVARFDEFTRSPAARNLTAMRTGNVFAVDATSCFSRPGPRVVQGTRILAHILHPERVPAPRAAAPTFKLDGDRFTVWR